MRERREGLVGGLEATEEVERRMPRAKRPTRRRRSTTTTTTKPEPALSTRPQSPHHRESTRQHISSSHGRSTPTPPSPSPSPPYLSVLLLIAVLTAFLPTASSAPVCGDTTLHGSFIDLVKLDDPIWDVRRRMCTTSGDCREEAGVKCVLASDPFEGVYVKAVRVGGVPGGGRDGVGKVPFPGCLDAFRDIIGECFDKQDRMSGAVYLAQETYEMSLHNFTTDPPVEEGRRAPRVTTTTLTTTALSTTSTEASTSTTTTTTTTSTTSTPSNTDPPLQPSNPPSLSAPATIGIAAGVPIGIIALAALLFLLCRRRRRLTARTHAPIPSTSPTNLEPSDAAAYPMIPPHELAQPVPELITEANAKSLGKHLHGSPRLQAPLLMQRGGWAAGQVYTPGELRANEGVGAELPGARMDGPMELDAEGYYGAGWKKPDRA